MKIELLLDEDIHSGLALALRKRGYDVIHAQELDRKGKSDSEQLLFAIQQKRCIFTVYFYFQCERFCNPPQPVCKERKRTLGDHCFKTTFVQRNDVKIVAPASV